MITSPAEDTSLPSVPVLPVGPGLQEVPLHPVFAEENSFPCACFCSVFGSGPSERRTPLLDPTSGADPGTHPGPSEARSSVSTVRPGVTLQHRRSRLEQLSEVCLRQRVAMPTLSPLPQGRLLFLGLLSPLCNPER